MDSGTILLVEDSADDVFFLQRALKKAQIENPLQVVVDGQQALDYLGGVGNYSNRKEFPLPCLLLLDLKLPRVNGFEVLGWIRQQASLSSLPVVILTSSGEERDRKRAAELGAKAYMVKPPDPVMMRELIDSVTESKRALAGVKIETELDAACGSSFEVT